MNDPVWQSASCIEDFVVEMRRMVDQAELSPTSEIFYRMRMKLMDVENEAGFIMAQSTSRSIMLDYADVIEPAADSSSRPPAVEKVTTARLFPSVGVIEK